MAWTSTSSGQSLLCTSHVQAIAHSLTFVTRRTFTRDAKHLTEKTQCLKLVRSLLSLSTVISPASSSSSGRGRIPLSDAIVRTLVSVAENADDPFKGICLETLAEIGQSQRKPSSLAVLYSGADDPLPCAVQPSSTYLSSFGPTRFACSYSASLRVHTSLLP